MGLDNSLIGLLRELGEMYDEAGAGRNTTEKQSNRSLYDDDDDAEDTDISHDEDTGSIPDVVETENIEFHAEGHSAGIASVDSPENTATNDVKLTITPADARRGFIMSEIIGKPLALRRK